MQLNAYLNFNGQCEAAFKFYEKCLGGKIVAMGRFEDMPEGGGVSPEWRSKIMHAQLDAGGAVLMGSDAPNDRYQNPQGFSVSLQTNDPAEADRVFNALSENGAVGLPIQETPWASRFGMLVDRYGIPWMVNCQKAAASASAQS
jgi:PhnB protein